ncbi:MAG: Stf0 family sulfotransferase, partial [Pseudomonadota bacterium]
EQILRYKRLTDLFPSLRVVYIERNDKVLQAISLYRAAVTNRFHKRTDGRWLKSNLRDHVVDEDVRFDEERIANFLGAIEKQCESWEAFFASNEIAPYRLIYEDFEHSPQDVLNGIYGYICNEAYDEEVELGYQKLQDDLSSDWATRIKSRAGPAGA